MGVKKPLDASERTIVAKGGIGGSDASPVYIESLIAKGGQVKEDLQREKKEWAMINLRISSEMLYDVDAAVNERVGITRTGWILEAIHEKLMSEGK
jgi:hypothetical protein